MRWIFIAIVLLHGLIQLMGSAKAFGYAELGQLATPISRPMALGWLLAALLCLGTVAALVGAVYGFLTRGPTYSILRPLSAACPPEVTASSAESLRFRIACS